MTNRVTATMLVIGDEILSGRTHDTNSHHVAQCLTAYGIDLKEVRFVSDEHAVIVKAVIELASTSDYLFTTGGIGPTHDDITAEAIAEAVGRPLTVHPEAKAILQQYYDEKGLSLNEARLRMARTPEGADLIPNAVTGAPGFVYRNIYVMAGVPRIMQSMLNEVLPKLRSADLISSETLQCRFGEGDISEGLSQIQETNSDVSIGSYPGKDTEGSFVNLVVRSANSERNKHVIQLIADFLKRLDER